MITDTQTAWKRNAFRG